MTLADNLFCIECITYHLQRVAATHVHTQTTYILVTLCLTLDKMNFFFFVKVCSSNAESVPTHNRWYQYIILCTVLFLNPFLDQLVAPCNCGDRGTATTAAAGL